jgi:GTP cyclohydrolase I
VDRGENFYREIAEEGVRSLLEYCGEDCQRDGLKDTPKRVAKAWKEMCSGYDMDPAQILSRTFEQDQATLYNGMVILRNVEFTSLCEHHVLPFTGSAHIVYIPSKNGKIVGISKLARLVDCFALRLQVQERLTKQIANAIEEFLQPDGCMVVIEAAHNCMHCRGVRKHKSSMVTSELTLRTRV